MNREHGVTVSSITHCCTRADPDGCCTATVTTPALPERSLPEDRSAIDSTKDKVDFPECPGREFSDGVTRSLQKCNGTWKIKLKQRSHLFHDEYLSSSKNIYLNSYVTIECKASKTTVLPKCPRLAETTVTVPQDEADLDTRRHDMNVKI
ncbi:hypothetical protein CDAR_412071 [Caerostris darwini]|uniref:Uncharacterized protein n=1 Tax=Caerostris darwini TaxID=1538125 RepID=A0AAV4WBQ3_9ARAC|nr:hypothetical protein CDAR_412071 [Caerostris darwini]